jgi:hypothetical protein
MDRNEEIILDEIKPSEPASFLERLSAPYLRRKQKSDQAESISLEEPDGAIMRTIHRHQSQVSLNSSLKDEFKFFFRRKQEQELKHL